MMTAEERVESLHLKMQKRRHAVENRKTRVLGAACGVLAVCLVLVIFGETTRFNSAAGMYSGTMMLFGDVGAYVLTAVIAFMAGVLITVILKKQKDKPQKTPDDDM